MNRPARTSILQAATFMLACLEGVHGTPRDVEIMLGRLRDPMVAARIDQKQADRWLTSLQPDGRWPDVDYSITPDKQKSYAHSEHQKRCRTLAHMLAKKQGDSVTALRKIGPALAVNLTYRHTPRFTYANDWYATYISVPSTYADTLVLLDGLMPRDELLKYSAHLRDSLEVPRGDGKPFQFKDTGQNLQWVAHVTLRKAAVERDEEMMRKCFTVVSSTIAYQDKAPEGIKADAMFHQHGRQIYNGGYGLWYVGDMVNWFKRSAGTSFAREFKREQLAIFRRMLLGGHQWASYRGVMDFGTRGRNISRPRNQGGVADGALEVMADFDKANAAKYSAWIAHNHGGPFPEPGNRHFWKSDFMVHRGGNSYCSAKVISSRTAGTETMNGENLLGRNLPLGATCIMTTGREYDEIYPVWDWSRIPGTTAALGVESPSPHVFNGNNPFAGGVSDGRSGILAFSLEDQGVRSSKAYFGLGDAMVCLGSGISSAVKPPVATSINQCLAKGDVIIDGVKLSGGKASGSFQWLHHDRIGYVMLDKTSKIEVRAIGQKGSWRRISDSQSPDAVSKPVFSAWIDHGLRPDNAAYAYFIAPDIESSACARLATSHGFQVIRNDRQVQALAQPEMGLLGIVFHEAGQLQISKQLTISAEQPALVLVTSVQGRRRIFVGDPLCKTERIQIRISGAAYTATMGTGETLGRTVEAIETP